MRRGRERLLRTPSTEDAPKRRYHGVGVSRATALAAAAGMALVLAGAIAAEPTATVSGGGTATAGTPSVDPLLRAQLRRSATAAATVTTWSRAGLADVQRLGVRGTKLNALPMILAPALTRAQLRALERSAAVRSVWANRTNRILMEETTWITKAREVWPAVAAGGLGVTGNGVHLAVIDTGADGQHEDMDNLVEFCDTTQALTSNRTSVMCAPHQPASGNVPAPTNDPRIFGHDDDGHGSHTSGTVAGSGQASGGRTATHSTIGMAPDAKLHVYSANVGPSLQNHEILASYDDMINKKRLGLSQVVAVNNSWGGGGGSNYNPGDAQLIAVKRAYDEGILSIFSAGNSGPDHNTLGRHCVSPYVVCVAASTKPDSIVAFSSRGRPSEPADTNRDGTVGGAGDVAPDNHDRALGQATGRGLYRPTLTAPGVNVFSISANSPTCREGGPTADSGCYEPLNGTSMSAPHVTGAVGLIVEAYRQGHEGATPTPAQITDILERSAAVNKLPGYEAEEQGAGRLNVLEAVKFAKTHPLGLPQPVYGTPTPRYAPNSYPGVSAANAAAGVRYTEKGCTGTASWTIPRVENPLDVDGPPLGTTGFGEHVIDVGPNTERLRVTINWSRHPGSNIYIRLWRPGVDPDQETASAGQARVFPDNEALGLLTPASTPYIGPQRWFDIRAAESSSLEQGPWILRVYHRVGGAPAPCDADSQERPKVTEGYNYTLTIERPVVEDAPTVAITSPADGTTHRGRFVQIDGTAAYPERWPGVTNWELSTTAPFTNRPTLLRVTDHHNALVVAWNALTGAVAYEVHRSTDPAFAASNVMPSGATLVATTSGTACSSPDVPSWPTASRTGLCYTDADVVAGTTYYYRVVGLTATARTNTSNVASGTPTAYDRQVKVKVDRVYGPQYWEYAALADETAAQWTYTWDTLELVFGTHAVGARSFTQGIGSATARLGLTLVEPSDDRAKVRICHATGADPPYVPVTAGKGGIVNGHLGTEHRGGGDIVPPFEWRGESYSQNWPAGQAVWENGCRTTE